jgi:hypothetical protein
MSFLFLPIPLMPVITRIAPGENPIVPRRRSNGFRRDPLGLRQKTNGFRRDPLGFRQKTNGFRRDPLGFRQKTNGFRRNPLGFRQKTNGFCRDPLGFRQKTNGFRQKTNGFRQIPHTLGRWLMGRGGRRHAQLPPPDPATISHAACTGGKRSGPRSGSADAPSHPSINRF